jgi:hypothetical protein
MSSVVVRKNFELNSRVLRIAALAVSLTVAFGAWVYASPVGSDPDADFHLTSIWCGSGFKQDICEQAETNSGEVVEGVVLVPEAITKPYGYPVEISDVQEMAYSTRNNQNGLYPRGFYWFTSKLVQQNIVITVHLLRWMNVLLYVLLIVAANLVLSHNLRMSLSLTNLTMLLPLGLFLVASSNPSAWAITGLGTFWAFLFGYFGAKTVGRILCLGALCLLSGLLASQSRADAAAFLPVVIFFVARVSYTRNYVQLRELFKKSVLMVVILIPALISFVASRQSSVISEGFVNPDGLYGRDPSVAPGFNVSSILYNISKLPGLFAGSFSLGGTTGGLAWGNIFMPEIVSLGMIFLLCYLTLNAFGRRSKTESKSLLLFLLFICILPLVILQKSGRLLPELVQTRYLLPLIVPFMGIFFSGSRLTFKIGQIKQMKRLISTVLISSYVIALHTTMRFYVHDGQPLNWNLNNNQKWWWNGIVQPMTVLFMGSIAFASYVFIVLSDGETSTTGRFMTSFQRQIENWVNLYLSKPKKSRPT